MKSLPFVRIGSCFRKETYKELFKLKITAPRTQINQINKLIIMILLIMFSMQCITTKRIYDDLENTNRSKRNSSYLLKQQISTIMNGLLFADETENLISDEISVERFRSLNKGTSLQQFEHSFSNPFSSLSTIENRFFRREWNFTEVNLANSHLFYIRTKYSCSTPRAKLVKVLDYHSSPSKQYVPRCTVLHRCDDESGCCEDVTHRCEPSKTQLVELYFHVIRSDIKNNITGGNAVGIERLTFLNHTQCECKPINYMPRSVQIRPPIRLVTKSATNQSHQHQGHHHHKCKHVIKCPQPFVQRFRGSDQRCICDCVRLSGHAEEEVSYKYCLKIQDGLTKVDPFWARCINAEECSEPVCSFGLRYNQTEFQCSPYQTSLRHRIRHSFHHHHHRHPRTSYHRHYQPVW